MENIFVPSKNRVNAPFLKNAHTNGISITVAVEPQDFNMYYDHYGENSFNYLILPKNDMGITYVRNQIKDFAETNNLAYYWQIDDDITNFSRREGNRMIKDDFWLLLENARKQFQENDLTLGGLDYRQLAWCAKVPLIKNSFCDCVVWVDTEKLKRFKYREQCIEDRDMIIQVLMAKQKTGRTTLYAYDTPPNGSNAGGLKEIFYDVAGKQKQAVQNVVDFWGEEICSMVQKDGKYLLKIHWKKLNSKQTSLF